jgi:3D (Asp-Asp-Asp) domain-containing protein
LRVKQALLSAALVTILSTTLTVKATAYCLQGYTRTGTYTSRGTIAVDPRVIPLGSIVYIEGFNGYYVAEDTGSGVIGSHIDIWFDDCNSAIQFGVQYLEVTWTN